MRLHARCLVHADIKMNNFLLTKDMQVLLSDMGGCGLLIDGVADGW